jgi:transposase
MKTILAAPNLLKIEKIALYQGEVRLVVKTKPLKSACPSCDRQSNKVHSQYQRQLADLPWRALDSVVAYLAEKSQLCKLPG